MNWSAGSKVINVLKLMADEKGRLGWALANGGLVCEMEALLTVLW